jgi:hypothetical protein
MGIEPTRKTVLDLENKQYGAITNAKCDGRVKFRGMWGYIGTRRLRGACSCRRSPAAGWHIRDAEIGAANQHSRNLRASPPSGIVYCNCDALEMFMSNLKSRTIPPLRVSEELRADAESVLAPGETLSAFVMDAVSRTIDFRKSQLDFLARGIASAERARAEGDYVPADKVIAGLRKRLANAQRVRK